MKIRNLTTVPSLSEEIQNHLKDIRRIRNFNADIYLNAKGILLNDYMRLHHLKTCIVAVSGGLDSAVVLGIVHHASLQLHSPIKRIYPVLMPIFDTTGATGQEQALNRGRSVCFKFGIEPIVIDLSQSHQLLKTTIDHSTHITGEDWASGQLVSYIRTPTLYYLTSLLNQENMSAIICGTTNRDEGAYLGYFGKASDYMVDLQLISDLHKSEVAALAHLLKIPDEIIDAIPSGDLFDGKTDEEVFGAPYDFVEFYLNYLCWGQEKQNKVRSGWNKTTSQQFDLLSHNLEALHQYNGHKYLSRSPAIHLDILESSVPGGWSNIPSPERPLAPEKLPAGLFEISTNTIESIQSQKIPESKMIPLKEINSAAFYIEHLFSSQECKILLDELEKQIWVNAGRDGYRLNSAAATQVGSHRATANNQELAEIIWHRLCPIFSTIRIMDENTPTDCGNHAVWRSNGINPLLRFIRYEKGGLLIPHYDAPFIQDERRRTLTSLVIYLSDQEKALGGETRFILDPQTKIKKDHRQYHDWTSVPSEEDVLLSIKPRQGSAILFDHRILHDSAEILDSNPKTIIRTDILYERCDWYRS